MARKNPKTPDAARPLSCVLYIRVSTKLQVEKGESIDAQRFELTRYAENHDMRVLGEYVDAGFSGKNVQGRPQFRQMMDDIVKAQPGTANGIAAAIDAAELPDVLGSLAGNDTIFVVSQTGEDSQRLEALLQKLRCAKS